MDNWFLGLVPKDTSAMLLMVRGSGSGGGRRCAPGAVTVEDKNVQVITATEGGCNNESSVDSPCPLRKSKNKKDTGIARKAADGKAGWVV